jgi:hypothetical protein
MGHYQVGKCLKRIEKYSLRRNNETMDQVLYPLIHRFVGNIYFDGVNWGEIR